jgi:hypothetical protein
MIAAMDIQAPLARALEKLHRCDPLTPEDARLIDASMPVLTAEDFEIGAEVDAEAYLAYLRGERADDPCGA